MKTVPFTLLFIVQCVVAWHHWYGRGRRPHFMRWGRDVKDGCNPPMPRRQYERWQDVETLKWEAQSFADQSMNENSEWEEQQWTAQSPIDNRYADESSYEYDYVYE
jgi:hypothetical protein